MNRLPGNKSIFSNQFTKRDLFTSSSDRNESQSSSQIEFTQQDFTYSADSVESQGMRMFDGYSNNFPGRSGNRAIFKTRKPLSQGTYSDHSLEKMHMAAKPTFQQQIELKKAQARERDERDLMNTILYTVKESSDEVKEKLRVVCNNLGEMFGAADDRVRSSTDNILDAVSENLKKVVSAVQIKDDQPSEIHSLKEKLSKSEAVIAELKRQLDKHQAENENNLVEVIKKLFEDHHTRSSKLLQNIQDSVQEQLENQKQIMEKQQIVNDGNSKLQQQLQKYGAKTENSLISHSSKLRGDLEKQKEEIQEYMETCLDRAQNKQIKEFNGHFQTGLEKLSQISNDNNKDMGKIQLSRIEEIMQLQYQSLETCMCANIQEQIEKWQNKYGNSRDKMTDKKSLSAQPTSEDTDKKNWNEKYEIGRLKQKNDIQERRKWESCKSRAKRNDISAEVASNKSPKRDFWTNNTGNNETGKSSFRKPVNFVSPGYEKSKWNSDYHFNKVNPSPVAKVLPQRQDARNQRKFDGHSDYVYGNTDSRSQCQTSQNKINDHLDYEYENRNLRSVSPTGQRILNDHSDYDYEKRSTRSHSPTSNTLRRSQRLANMNFPCKGNNQNVMNDYSDKQYHDDYNETKNMEDNQKDVSSKYSEERQVSFNERGNNSMWGRGNEQRSSNESFFQQEMGKDGFHRNWENLFSVRKNQNLNHRGTTCNLDNGRGQHRGLDYTKQTDVDIYEFSDETSIVPSNSKITSSEGFSCIQRDDDDDDNEDGQVSSNNSSPCLSVTQIFIKRKVKQDRSEDISRPQHKRHNSGKIGHFGREKFAQNYKMNVGSFQTVPYLRRENSPNDSIRDIFPISRSRSTNGQKRKLYDRGTEMMEITQSIRKHCRS